MSRRARSEQDASRLLDIVVEEVSLVDRAANKQRFLIVKRSNEMDETTTESTAEETQASTEPAMTEDSGKAMGAEAETQGSEREPHLDSALDALEKLTEAVEILGQAGPGQGQGQGRQVAAERLAELAEELHTAGARLAELAGVTPPGEDAPSSEDGPSSNKLRSLEAAIAAVREILARVTAALEERARRTTNEATSDEGEAKEEKREDDGQLSGLLSSLSTELRTLASTVGEQQQRLARLEKRFGLPNSTPSGEKPSKPDNEDIGWPMDLNRPLDRESVDKTTSFHDL